MNKFLPISPEEIAERGWEQLDFLFISGDAYMWTIRPSDRR